MRFFFFRCHQDKNADNLMWQFKCLKANEKTNCMAYIDKESNRLSMDVSRKAHVNLCWLAEIPSTVSLKGLLIRQEWTQLDVIYLNTNDKIDVKHNHKQCAANAICPATHVITIVDAVFELWCFWGVNLRFFMTAHIVIVMRCRGYSNSVAFADHHIAHYTHAPIHRLNHARSQKSK